MGACLTHVKVSHRMHISCTVYGTHFLEIVLTTKSEEIEGTVLEVIFGVSNQSLLETRTQKLEEKKMDCY